MWHDWGVEKRIQDFVGQSEGKTPLGRPRCRCEESIKLELKELEWQVGIIWLRIEISGRVVMNTVMKI
jgi:hypothetical protein